MDDIVNHSQAYWQSRPAECCSTEASATSTNADAPDFTLGMSSFDEKERRRFGESMRLSMALIEGKSQPTPIPGNALPNDAPSIAQRLKSLSEDIAANLADQLELLTRFDALNGWESGGAKNCASWMNLELGIGIKLAREYLRVGRDLRDLPIVTALFRAGKLTWSKVRLLTRVANDDNEPLLCHAALDASVSQVERLCNEHHWQNDKKAQLSDRDHALQQWESRALRWDDCSNGNVRISLSLPPHHAQAFLNSVEYSLGQLEPGSADCSPTAFERTPEQTSMTQRRADAALLMAENSLQNAGRDIATADRYQVIVSVDAAELAMNTESKPDSTSGDTPKQRATLIGASSSASGLAKSTARRLACDCSVSAIITDKGEPVNIGQKARIWPAAMARAIRVRDKTCVWPGCTQSRYLQIHHIIHWADGGETSIENGACVCSHHHQLLHEGGYRIEHVANNEQRQYEQFKQQTVNAYQGTWAFEERLRYSPESFDAVRSVSPERFRFRVIDSNGRDVIGRKQATRVASQLVRKTDIRGTRNDYSSMDSIAEPRPQYTTSACLLKTSANSATFSTPCTSGLSCSTASHEGLDSVNRWTTTGALTGSSDPIGIHIYPSPIGFGTGLPQTVQKCELKPLSFFQTVIAASPRSHSMASLLTMVAALEAVPDCF